MVTLRTNADRARHALATLRQAGLIRGDSLPAHPNTSDLRDAVADLLTDLMHLCDQAGVSYAVANSQAFHNFQDQTTNG